MTNATGSANPSGGGSMRRHYLLLAAIVAAAIALRTLGVENQGLWFDEGLTIVISRWSIGEMLILPTDPTPILYYLLHKLFIPPDTSLLGVRSISIVFGVISIGLMYALGRLSFGRLGGLIAAGLLAVWTAHVDYSQEARAYSLLFMLTLSASLGVVVYARAANRFGRLLGLALLASGDVLSFYTHLTAVFWIAATSLIVLSIAIRERRPRWEILGAFAIMAVLALPGLYRLSQGPQDGSFDWLAQPDLQRFLIELARVVLPVGFWENQWLGAGRPSVGYAIEFVSFAALAASLWRWGPRLRGAPAVPIIVAYLAMPFLIWGVGVVASPIYMSRTILFVVPGLILLITGLCVASPAPRLGFFVLSGTFLISTLLYGLMREKEDLRGSVRLLETAARPGDIIAICGIKTYPAMRYHARTPTGAAVIGADYEGRLVGLEGPLGSNSAWDQQFFDQIIAADKDRSKVTSVPIELALAAGRIVWRVASNCGDGAKAGMDAALLSAGATCVRLWRQELGGQEAVSVSRCAIGSAASWRVLVPSSTRQGATL